MKGRPKGAFVCTSALTLFVLALLLAAGDYPEEVRLVPYLAGIPTLFLLFLLLLGEFVPGVRRWTEVGPGDLLGGDRGRPPGVADEAPAPWPAVLRIIGWIFGFLLFFFFFGFFVAPPIFVATFLVVEAKVAPFKAAATALLVNGLLYAGMRFLQVEFWTGAVPEIIVDYVGGAIVPPL